MIVAADDVGDAHVMVVDDHREHVGRGAVGAQQDEIVELGIGDRDAALDEVLDHRLAVARRLQADDERRAFRPGVAAVAPLALEPERPPLGLGLLAPRLQLLGRQIAAIGGAALDQLVGDLGVARLELRLEIGVAVPVEAEPLQPVEDRRRSLPGSSAPCRCPRSRSSALPPWWRAKSQENRPVRALPMCRKPVGEGAKRVTPTDFGAVIVDLRSSALSFVLCRPCNG